MAKRSGKTGQELHRTVFEGDNLDVLRGVNSESVDLVYLDPPFNSNKTYEAPVGSKAAGAAFKDAWTLSDVDLIEHNRLRREQEWLYALIHAAKNTHSKGMFSYLMMMSPRLFELNRVLKPTGSIYLHCDPTASHYLKLVMDGIFGSGNFRNEVIWKRTSSHSDSKSFGRVHDTILHYSMSERFAHNRQHQSHDPNYVDSHYRRKDARGRRYRTDNVTAGGLSGGGYEYEWNGVSKVWRYPKNRMLELHDAGRLHYTRTGTPEYIRYLSESEGVSLQTVWADISPINSQAKERVGYPTQKPLALLDRIVKASSNEGDVVLDPFCGCATTLVSAELLQRRWCGIDLSPKTAELVVQRIREKEDMVSFAGFRHATDVPIRTDVEREKASTPKQRRELKNKLHNDQEGRCNLCHDEFTGIQHFEMDHIVPVAKGGQDWVDNFQLLCSNCNRIKGKGTQEAARAKIAKNKGIDFGVFE